MIGKTLGSFECTALLGKGGMGEVYKAKDQKLGREVAIKVLPEEFAKDADRVARFQREAKLLASLNHNNIASIYGLEESDGTHFLVLELIEGDTLADRLKRGAIPVEESLKLALQIAEALEAAHEKGVIHRDLKPANIKVTPEGQVKVLDFGLAKAFAGEQSEVNLSHSPTLSEAATLQGVILGTAAYMSPEQARGKPVDKRTDIWAFGCVLYEMLTGKAAFQGEDVTEILAAVVKSGVNLDLLPANIHFRIMEAIIRCLQKEQKKRYGAIGEAQYEIEQVLADPSGVFVKPVATAKPRKKLRVGIPWVAAAIVLAGVAVWLLKPAPPPEPKQVTRFEYELPAGQQFNRNVGGVTQYQIAVSPDGSQFVYSTREGLYLRSMNALDARFIAGTDTGSFLPFFSPDGQWIGCYSQTDQKLKKFPIGGGAPVSLCDTSVLVPSASWGVEDRIVYSDITSGIMQVSENGGAAEVLINGSLEDIAKEGFPDYPQMLPDGRTLLFTNERGSDVADNQIVVQSLQSGERKVLVEGGRNAKYLPTGHIIYELPNNNVNNLFAVPFDLDELKVTGGSISVLEGVGGFGISNSGTLIYVPQPAITAGAIGATSSGRTLVWVDRQGKEESLGAAPDAYDNPKISPDGTKVALTIAAAGNQDIWIWDIPHKTPTKLTFNKANDNNPLWTPDNKRIVFSSNRNGILGDVYWKSAEGIDEAELLASKPDSGIAPWSFSRDGKILAFLEFSLSPLGFDIGMMSMEDNREMKGLLKEEHWELEPQISPDGRYMAYQSDESGEGQIYVRSFPDVTKGRWQISNNGGNSPLWSPDGRELFYRNGDETMAVAVETEPTFKRGNPKILFRGTYPSTSFLKVALTSWDIHPDGKRFLMIKPPATTATESTEEEPAPATQPKITVVLNWFEELKERVPVE
jgi:serine/threonine-protein kinase